MTIRTILATGAAALALAAAPISAQSAPPKPKPAMDHAKADKGEHDKMHGESKDKDHASSGWKELDEYHKLMMDTWHPAKGTNDLKPLRAKAKDLSASAQALAKSTPPSSCNKPELIEAARDLVPASHALVKQVAIGASDADLKALLAEAHTKFEVLEKGCLAPGAKH
jgi:hypothetical protein